MADAAFELVALNMPEVEAAFDKASKRTSTRTLMYALREASKPIAKAWKAKARRRQRRAAPQQRDDRGRFVARSSSAGGGRALDRVPRSIRRRAGRRTSHEVTYLIASKATGFMGYEFGTSHQAPRPAARPALDETRGQVIDTVRDILQQVVEAERQVPDIGDEQDDD